MTATAAPNDPRAALEEIRRVLRRVWLSEEWRLEEILFILESALAEPPVIVSSSVISEAPGGAGYTE